MNIFASACHVDKYGPDDKLVEFVLTLKLPKRLDLHNHSNLQIHYDTLLHQSSMCCIKDFKNNSIKYFESLGITMHFTYLLLAIL
jgi:hypothetical protein